jgi:hypothetical protein
LKYLLILRNVVTKNLKKLMFVNKNWPTYLRIGCKFSSNLVEFLKKDRNLEEDLEKMKCDLEWDEVVEV